MIRYFLLSFPRPPGSIPLRSFPRSIPHALFSPVLSFHPLFTWQRCMHGTSNERVHLFSSRPLSGRASSLSNFVFSISHALLPSLPRSPTAAAASALAAPSSSSLSISILPLSITRITRLVRCHERSCEIAVKATFRRRRKHDTNLVTSAPFILQNPSLDTRCRSLGIT